MALLDGLQNVIGAVKGADDYITVLAFLLLLVIVTAVYQSMTKSQKYQMLPGPVSLPVVGYLPFVGQDPHKTFTELKKKYGPIFKVQMGSIPCVVIGNYDTVKEAFVKQGLNFSGRPHDLSFRVFDYETAFVFEEGEPFKHIKMFIIDTLKKLGLGRSNLEPLVKIEVQQFLDALKKLNGKATDIDDLISISSGNAICSLLSGQRHDYNDPWLNQVITAVNELLKTYTHDVSLFFPWIRKIPLLKKFTPKDAQIFWKKKIWELWKEKIEVIRRVQTNGELLSESLISCWLTEQKRQENNNLPTKDLFSDFNLENTIDLLSEAALETTATTLLWAFQYLLTYPDIQKKLQNEIDEVMETKGEDLSIEDLKFLPYLRAFIQETHRCASITPFGIFHCNMRETILNGYYIPKRMVTICNFYAIHHDEKHFSEPFEFKPERFISEDGQYIHCEKLVPFSLGKRQCPGEASAQMEIFLYLTRVLRTFDLKSAPAKFEEAAERPSISIIVRPKAFKLCFVEKKLNN